MSKTLAQTLGTTAPASPLLRKARSLGILNLNDAKALATARGCRHYPVTPRSDFVPPEVETFPNEELVALLLLGENSYDAMAIRYAAQMAGSPRIDPLRLVQLAHQTCTLRALAYIAHAGLQHDASAHPRWQNLLDALGNPTPRAEPALPHWSRFVSLPGYQRQPLGTIAWLIPSP